MVRLPFHRKREQMTKNYFAHGGNELIIGGKLTFLPGATVEGGDGLFDLPAGTPAAALPLLEDSTATTVAQLREDYNRLLDTLRSAGVLGIPPASDEDGGEE